MLKTASLSCPLDVDNGLLDSDRFVADLAGAIHRAGTPDRAQPSHAVRGPLP
jgi:hypothetical protein